MTEPETLYCYRHPSRETMLRCNNCGQPICAQCAILTPTGYRCPECVRGQQKKFNTAGVLDYVFAPVMAVVLSFIGSYIVQFLGFFTIFLAPIAGGIIAEGVKLVIRNRRSKTLFYIIAGAVVLGALPMLLSPVLSLLFGMQFGTGSVFGLLRLVYQVVYVVLCTGTVFYRLSGFRL
jgi:hypothetical protein